MQSTTALSAQGVQMILLRNFRKLLESSFFFRKQPNLDRNFGTKIRKTVTYWLNKHGGFPILNRTRLIQDYLFKQEGLT